MKKTIAILLVLVIGMAGVWAAEATLKLDTTVAEVNRIAITDTTVPKYAFPNLGGEPEVLESVLLNYDPSNVFGVPTPTDIGYIHYKTNNANSVSVTMAGTYLENEDNHNYIIPYRIIVKASTLDPAADGNDDEIIMIKDQAKANPVSDVSSVTLFEADNGTALFTDHRKIQISGVAGSAASYPAGKYSATITFTLTAN